MFCFVLFCFVFFVTLVSRKPTFRRGLNIRAKWVGDSPGRRNEFGNLLFVVGPPKPTTNTQATNSKLANPLRLPPTTSPPKK